jgi:putative transposase
MDEHYLLAAARYIELNPVRAKLTVDPREYAWSSAAAHIEGCDDALVVVNPLLEIVNDWQGFLAGGISDEEYKVLRKHERTGRPLGNTKFIARWEEKLGKALIPQKGGRPKKKN